MIDERPAPDRSRPSAPRVWLLTGHRAGDTTQILALAEALDWPFEAKRLVYRPTELVTNLLCGATLAGIDRRRSSPLTPPWPDLVITAGRRNEPVARWIKARSGGNCRIVHLGRPWAGTAHFDLVVPTPQYRLADAPNLLWIDLPLHRVTPQRLAAAAADWRAAWPALPRPWIALLVGGDSPPYRFDAAAAARLGREASAMAVKQGGSLLVTTSARTGKAAIAALRRAIDAPVYFHGWAAADGANPYLGFLALADALVVTGESMSMLAEACATAKPVYVFDPGDGSTAMRPRVANAERPIGARLVEALAPHRLAHRASALLTPAHVRRDAGIMVRRLVATGRVAWLGDPPPAANPPVVASLPQVVARVRALFPALPEDPPPSRAGELATDRA